jgi:hypothetical protein
LEAAFCFKHFLERNSLHRLWAISPFRPGDARETIQGANQALPVFSFYQ